MDSREFDAAAKMLANGRSRRQILRLLVCGATGGAAALLASTRATAKPSCRGEGHPCEGNQTCCEGLSCTTSGPGAARRCTAGAATECERDCPPAEQVVVLAVGADIDIEANCALAGDSNRTT